MAAVPRSVSSLEIAELKRGFDSRYNFITVQFLLNHGLPIPDGLSNPSVDWLSNSRWTDYFMAAVPRSVSSLEIAELKRGAQFKL